MADPPAPASVPRYVRLIPHQADPGREGPGCVGGPNSTITFIFRELLRLIRLNDVTEGIKKGFALHELVNTVKPLLSGPLLSGHLSISRNLHPIFTVNLSGHRLDFPNGLFYFER